MLDAKDSDVLTDRHNHLHVVAGKPMEVWELKEVYSDTQRCDLPEDFTYICSNDFSNYTESEDNEGIAMVREVGQLSSNYVLPNFISTFF
ncbi:hypothetical protein KIN20_034658 [Parelaphostrongylus tenuis]|uniref:Uncharacterized protein n=1 Tax=Parelaphostrongylus tenuis TaxID=148309 RepID=A0AAD5WJU3_PARTN|nr:hypothetical protein KIN20_034658 [Parelaphostrongylus tenuis]